MAEKVAPGNQDPLVLEEETAHKVAPAREPPISKDSEGGGQPRGPRVDKGVLGTSMEGSSSQGGQSLRKGCHCHPRDRQGERGL